MNKYLLSTFCLLSYAHLGCGTTDTTIPPPADWYVVWNDEFDGAAGPLDTNKWTFDIGQGQGGWGNEESQFYTDKETNVRVDGSGRLEITAIAEDFGGAKYTSARIKTQSLFAQQYGRIEARIQLPVGQGIWPAFWMLGADFPEVGWPECGEIDIMEYRGQEPKIVHGSLHGPGYSGGEAVTKAFRLEDGKSFFEEFHVFTVEWDPSRITWLVDDEVYQIVTSNDLRGKGRWVYDHPFFLILNIAVGGSFIGAPNASTEFPQSMLIDYVRVYSRQAP